MNIASNITNFFNNRKFNRLKNQYIETCQKQGTLENVTELQNFIKKKNIQLISSGKKYGDDYDAVEEIFSDNPKILAMVKDSRESMVCKQAIKLKDIFSKCQTNESVVAEDSEFKELVKTVLNFGNYYSDTTNSNKIDFRTNFEKKLDDFKKVSDIINSISGKNLSGLEYTYNFLNPMTDTIAFYSLKELNNTEDFLKKQAIMQKAQETLDGIDLQNHSNINFEELSKEYSSKSTKDFFKRLYSVKKLQNHGIDIQLDNDKISFIDTNDETQVEQFKKNVESKKGTLSPESLDVEDFAMVRTTEYFPINHEMETVDDLNSRVFIRNFLSDKFVGDELTKKYGENWFRLINNGTQKGKEIAQYQKELNKKYETLSTTYRSTKHFTLNGLVSSHEFGDFSGNPYIFIDPLEEHIKDEGLLSLNEADTYFKISREKPFKLSNKSEIMMPISEYLKLSDNPDMLEQIHSFEHLTLFSGDEEQAVAMRLYEKGYIPEKNTKWGYRYGTVMDNAVSNLSTKYNIPISVHSASDIKKLDDEKCIQMSNNSNELFVDTLFKRFSIDEKYRRGALKMNLSNEELTGIISQIGEDNIKTFISEFNNNTEKELDKKREEFYTNKEFEKDSKKVNNVTQVIE